MSQPRIRGKRPVQLAAQGPNNNAGPVTFMFTPGNQGVVQVGVRIDYSRTPPPDLTYFADYCSVQEIRHGMSFHFGKLDGSGAKLRTKIELSFPNNMFQRQLWATSESLRDTLAKNYSADEDTSALPDPEKIQTFSANNVFMVVQQDEALLDFYYLSPRETWIAYQKSTADTLLQGVVRISCGAWLLRQFLEKCRPYVRAEELEVAP